MATPQPGVRMPPPQHGGFPQQQQQQQQHQQQQFELEQKKLQDLADTVIYISNIRDDINVILDNIGKANSANTQITLMAAKNKSDSAASSDHQNKPQSSQGGQNSAISTPSSVSNMNSQQTQQALQAQSEEDQAATNESNERSIHLDHDQQQFLEKTSVKFLQDKIHDVNKNFVELDKLMKDIQPIQLPTICPEFNSILTEQVDERTTVNANKLVNNYRWCIKIQENINLTMMTIYKRFQQSYAEKKSPVYKKYAIKPTKKEELERIASNFLAHGEIKVVSSQKTEHQFVLDIIMPQNFKFVLLIFDLSVEKFQVRPLDSRLLSIYSKNKPSDEICCFDYETRNLSNVFQRLEENCLYACLFYKTEQGPNHLKYLMQWLKNFTNLFNAKCLKCEKHLLNGVPPTWRDLKSFEPYHDECRI